ncbi:GGDEF domain-containing protein [bacterium]|nr:GGDEF domain-containing protein [bacterium]NCT20778.1 GGDEF domain-containing protein [bacterium]OIO84129.1 MAG: hypothetical protein AUK01_10195 [Anaerolineae bacterium CG2_30_57_67]
MFENTELALDVLQTLLERGKITYALLKDDVSIYELAPNFKTFLNAANVQVGQPVTEIFDALTCSEQTLQEVLSQKIPEYRLEYINFSSPGFSPRYISLYIWNYRCNAPRRLLLVVEDVTSSALIEQSAIQAHNELYLLRIRLGQANAKLQRQALYDSLTELPNRRYLDDALPRYVEFSKRYQTPLSLMMMDIDDFKNLNDGFGHDVGDEGLRILSRVLSKSMRETDFTARYGGDEFCIFLPMLNVALARILVDKIKKALDKELESFSLRFTISVGIAALTSDVASAAELIKLADDALYRAKREGKNRIYISGEKK